MCGIETSQLCSQGRRLYYETDFGFGLNSSLVQKKMLRAMTFSCFKVDDHVFFEILF